MNGTGKRKKSKPILHFQVSLFSSSSTNTPQLTYTATIVSFLCHLVDSFGALDFPLVRILPSAKGNDGCWFCEASSVTFYSVLHQESRNRKEAVNVICKRAG